MEPGSKGRCFSKVLELNWELQNQTGSLFGAKFDMMDQSIPPTPS